MLLKTYFVTDKEEITISRYVGGKWYLNVQTGVGGTTHVEAREFTSYLDAVEYAESAYKLEKHPTAIGR